MPSVFFFISGHGFGHASRQIEVINALGAAAPAFDIHVRSSAPRRLFDRTVRVPIRLHAAECDTGVVQLDSLHLDERATMERAARFYDSFDARIEEETRLLRRHDARFVISDAPPLASAAAAAAGIASVVVANFTWDWIYEQYAEHFCRAPRVLPLIREAYGLATAAWRLPMHGGFDTIRNVVDVPFIARHARHEPELVRRRLGLPSATPLVLVSFGGFGVRDIDLRRVDCLGAFGVVLTCDAEPAGSTGPGVHTIPEATLYANGFRYEDLVRAVDVVLSKPGYGIISECIANGTALLYTSRGRFAEYDVLVSEMPRYLRCGFIDQQALVDGRWRAALQRVVALPSAVNRPATNGAETIAAMIAAH